MNGYLSLKPRDATSAAPALGVIIAQGPIMDGPGIAGSIGADDMIQRIRSAKNDQSIKGLILRVDSPGGSAFASELIRQELEAFQKQVGLLWLLSQVLRLRRILDISYVR